MATSFTDQAFYYIMNRNTLTCLNVNGNESSGANVVGAAANFVVGQANNVWQMFDQKDGTWKLRCPATMTWMYLDNDSALTTVKAWAQLNNQNQAWTFTSNTPNCSPTYWTITNVGTGLNVDLQNGNPAQGAPVVSQQAGSSVNQQWIIIPSGSNQE